MTDRGAEVDPHVLISARLRDNPKVIGLPSDGARWAWVMLLGEAKLQRPAGRFATRRVIDHTLGRYARHVPAFLSAGLLHVAPDLCDRCLGWLAVVRVGELVVHDWPRHQERRSRTQEWRLDRGLTSGHSGLGETPGKQPGNVGGNTGETLAPVRGDARPLQSQSQSLPPHENGVAQLDAAFSAMQTLTGLVPSRWGQFAERELGRLIDTRTAPTVASSMAKVAPAIRPQPPSPRQLVMAVVKDLEPFDRGTKKPGGHTRSEEEVERAFQR